MVSIPPAQDGTLDGFFAVAFDCGAIADGVGFGRCGVVVVAELHDDEIAGLKFSDDRGPHAGGLHVGAGRGATDGVIFDGYFFGVEVSGEDVAPAPLAVGAVIAAVFDGGVADDEEGGFVRAGGGHGLGDGGFGEGGEHEEGDAEDFEIHGAAP